MSTTIDNKVVEMRFDNKHFEKNVATSVSTLEKLKQSLNLTGASKGLENINSAAKNVDMNGLASGVEAVRVKFSALQIMGVTALTNIANTAVNTGKKIVSALTIDPIKTGFQEYETQINAVQTILANTSSKGTTLQDVNRALDELNTYADKTIYNFTEMTKNIGTFTAAGVDLDTSVSAIQGIANLAAVSGSTSQQASTAMYQLSQALAAGRVTLMDWNSVVNAGMGGQVFQDALKRTATNMGKDVDGMIEKYGSFRESLTQGEWLTTDVLTKTLEQFTMAAEEGSAEWDNFKKSLMEEGYTEAQATEILKMANTATDAATKVKTFTQLWDTLKESVQSGWTQSWELIVGDFEEAKEFLTMISDTIGGMLQASAESRNAVLSGGLSSGWKQLLGAGIADEEGYKETIQSVAKSHGVALDEMIKKEGSFEDALVSGLKSGQITSDMLSESVSKLSDKMSGMSAKEREAAGYTQEYVDSIKKLDEGLKDGSISMDEFVEKIIRPSGRENLIQALQNSFEGLMSIIKPVHEAFREVFPPITADQLYAFTEGLRKLTEHFIISEEAANNIKRTFKGIFSVVGIVVDAIKALVGGFVDLLGSFTGIDGGLLEITAAIGDWLTGLRESIKEADIFSKAIDGIVKFLSIGIETIIDALSGVGGSLADFISGLLNSLNFDNAFDIAQGGVFTGILLGIKKFTDGLGELTDGEGILANIKGILNDVRGCLEAYQNNLKADILKKIATAIAILAASIFIISTIDPGRLAASLVSIGALFAMLMLSLNKFGDMNVKFGSIAKATVVMLSLSTSVLILSAAMKVLSTIDTEGLIKGVATIGILMAELSLFLKYADFGSVIRTASGLVILSGAMILMAQAVKSFGNMSWEDIGHGLVAMGGALGVITIALHALPKNMISSGLGLIAVATSLTILAKALESFGYLSWTEIGHGLAAMGGSLLILAGALHLMKGTLLGSAALLVAAGALAIMVPVMKSLGGMSWESIGKGLLTIAAAFTIVGVAAALLQPLLPTILGLAGSMALIGLSIAGVGVGLTLIGVGITAIATGFTALTAAVAAGASSIVAALHIIITGVLDLIPSIIEKIGEGIVALCVVIGENAPLLAECFLQLIVSAMGSLAKHTPVIVGHLMDLIIGILQTLTVKIPELVGTLVELFMAVFEGVVEALKKIDPEVLMKGLAGIGLLTALMAALAVMAALTPLAMVGVLGMGVVITELAIVLSAIGALAQIPGLKWLVEEGGNFLQLVGTAIGQFIGGLVGGIGQGISNSLPKMGSDLSTFMTNIKPFIDGARTIDPSVAEGVTALATAILAITAAGLLERITSFLTGGSSLADFAKQLVPLGMGMRAYSTAVTGINTEAIMASASAAKGLAEVAKAIPREGGLWQLLAGEKDLASFGTQLVPFGLGMKQYSLAVTGINNEAIIASAEAAKGLAEVAKAIPRDDGLWQLLAGDKDLSEFGTQLVPFGLGMKQYAAVVTGINTEAITASADAAKGLVEVAKSIPLDDGVWQLISGDKDLTKFGSQLVPFGMSMLQYSLVVSGINTSAIMASVTAAQGLAELAKAIPSEGGIWQLLAGEKDFTMFATQLTALGTGIKGYANEVNGIDADAVTASAKAAVGLAELSDTIAPSGGLKSLFTGDVDLTSFSDSLLPIGEGMAEYGNAVSGLNVEAVTGSVTAVSKLVEVLDDMEGISATGASSFKTAVNELADTNVSGFIKAFAGSSSKFENIGADILGSINQGISSKQGVITKSISTIVAEIYETITGKKSNFEKAGKSLMDALVNGIKNNSSKITSAIKSVLDTAVSSIRSYNTSFYNAGSYLVYGFANGISANQYAAAAKARAMASAAAEAARAALDEHSPSRVGYEIGDFFGIGFVNAIGDNIKRSYSAGYEMAEYAKNGLSNAISKIRNFIEDGVDAQPTIRPVLDLSNVESGIGSISGMFDSNTFGLAANIGSINSMMNKRNQNGVGDQIVSALDKLRTDLGNVNNTSYTINGLTYDDGTNVSNAVQELIRYAQIERRV